MPFVHQITFIMTHFLSLRNRMGAVVALLIMVTSTSAAFGQRRGSFLEPRRAGAFELNGTALLAEMEAGDLMVHPGIELTCLGRSAGPLHRGVRIGLGILDRSGSLAGSESGTSERRRTFLPEVSGVLRLAPFRGGVRPFAEGELGMAATILDVRTFDSAGDRMGYAVPNFDPTLHYGWAAGARIRIGDGAFITVRYGERFGGQLEIPNPIETGDAPTQIGNERRVMGMGFSLAL